MERTDRREAGNTNTLVRPLYLLTSSLGRDGMARVHLLQLPCKLTLLIVKLAALPVLQPGDPQVEGRPGCHEVVRHAA